MFFIKFGWVIKSRLGKSFSRTVDSSRGKLEVLDYALRNKDTSSYWYNVVEDLIRKEFKEEVGLNIKNIGYVTSLVYIISDNIPSLIISLWGEPVGEKVVLCPALTEYKWVTLEEAKEYNLIEGIYEELEILDKKLVKQKNEVFVLNFYLLLIAQ